MRKKTVALALFLAAGICACEPEEPFPEGIPQERWRWENPAGYGLPPAEEEYSGLVY